MHRNSHGIKKPYQNRQFGDFLYMQFLKQLINDTCVYPTTKTFVDNMPIAVFFWQPPPFAAVFAYIQQCVYKGYVIY